MKLEIGKPLKKVKKLPKNQYKFIISLMGGDADAYFSQKLFVDGDDPNLERFLNFLDNCEKEYPRGKKGFDDYTGVEDYHLFVGYEDDYPEEIEENGVWRETTQEDLDKWDKEGYDCGIQFEWESNHEYFGVSSFDGFTVTYFDENSIEHKVKVIK